MPQASIVTLKEFENLKQALAQAGSLEIGLVSNSMAPVLPTGARARLEPASFETLANFDFIVFLQNEKLICHAIWERGYFKSASGERTLITRGLANPFADDPVKESMILGRVTSHSVSARRFFFLSLKNWILWKLGLKRNVKV